MPKSKNKLNKDMLEAEQTFTLIEAPGKYTQPLFERASELVDKNWKRSKDFQNLLEKTQKLLNDLLSKTVLKNAILKLLSQSGNVDLLHPNVLRNVIANLVAKKVDKPAFEEVMRNFENFIKNLVTLARVYEARIKFIKGEDGKIRMELVYEVPNYELFKLKGREIETAESIENLIDFYEKILEFESVFNEIDIQDETTDSRSAEESNPLFKVFSATSNVSPTIIKYKGSKGFKKMLICIPADMDVTTFMKQYWGLISKSHRDFYQKGFIGRPRSMAGIEKLIRELCERELDGTRYSLNRKCEILSNRLRETYKIDLKPSSIRRHYKQVVKDKQRVGKK